MHHVDAQVTVHTKTQPTCVTSIFLVYACVKEKERFLMLTRAHSNQGKFHEPHLKIAGEVFSPQIQDTQVVVTIKYIQDITISAKGGEHGGEVPCLLAKVNALKCSATSVIANAFGPGASDPNQPFNQSAIHVVSQRASGKQPASCRFGHIACTLF